MKQQHLNKIFTTITILFIIITLTPLTTSANTSNQRIMVNLDGRYINMHDQGAIIQNGQILVPVREVFGAMGYRVDWNSRTQTATVTNGTYHIAIRSGDAFFNVNGLIINPSVPPQNLNGRLLLPLMDIARFIGLETLWSPSTNTLWISTTPGAIMNPYAQFIHIDNNRNITINLFDIGTVQMNANGELVLKTPEGNVFFQASEGLDVPVITFFTSEEFLTSQSSLETIFATSHATFERIYERLSPFFSTTSAIQIPGHRAQTGWERNVWIDEYNAMGGASDFELEVVRLTNLERTSRGLRALEIDESLMMASRFYAQTLANLDEGLSHFIGPYGGSGGTATSFNTLWHATNGQAGRWTPQDVVYAWMASAGHRDNILNPNLRFMGAGSHLGGEWGIFHYQIFRY